MNARKGKEIAGLLKLAMCNTSWKKNVKTYLHPRESTNDKKKKKKDVISAKYTLRNKFKLFKYF